MIERTASRKGGARLLARQAMIAQVSAMAFQLFQTQGYEATTVDDICAVAEISRSTFFRYFSSKEDALLSQVAQSPEDLLYALESRPDDEEIWLALRRALDVLIERYAAEPESARRLARLISTTPALSAKHTEKNARWQGLLKPELARRLGIDPARIADPRPAALIASALGCVDAAISAWASTEGTRPLGEILDVAMDTIPL